MKTRRMRLTALFFLAATSAAAAGPVVDAAQEAETLSAAGKTAEALQALDKAVDAIWRGSPLAFRKVALVDSFGGYGIYDERADTTFRPDDKMMIYVEPVGFGYGGSAAATTIGFDADLAIRNATGQVIVEREGLMSLSTQSAPNRREFAMNLSFGVPFVRPGEYTAVFTLHDQNSDKSGSFEIPFTIALPTAN